MTQETQGLECLNAIKYIIITFQSLDFLLFLWYLTLIPCDVSFTCTKLPFISFYFLL
uniref:Uncharacterized protein n=1 Tax=Nelumbo nucifera TaxID=4432 RepID=A0A822ZNN2_NELNU|nr:TPA_asm: hypothetical protein HUJ06_003361 [Nelumbo nucifera]